ncbi:major facilitator superfamily transporter [Ceratobasidium sp. AG-Ba]|nr:major facilitator superfamily transporter [Ceratobasidium sp. AG-Ba]
MSSYDTSRDDQDVHYAREEERPLLYAHDIEGSVSAKPAITPIPKAQLSALCLTRLAEPIAYTQIFPYINQMIEDLGIAKSPAQVGFYSGVVDSIFSFAQLFTIYAFGKMSDRVGRKPVILFGLSGIALSTSIFGLSNTFTWMVMSRTIAGLFSGNVAVIHSVLGEITDETNSNIAFPLYGLCWPIGAIVGPLIGGSVSHPLSRFSHVLPSWTHGFLQAYPYALPCIVSSVITLLTVAFAYFFLEESLPAKRKQIAEKLPESPVRPTMKHTYGSALRQTPTSTLPPLASDDTTNPSTHIQCVGDSTEVQIVPPKHDFSISGLLANKAIRTLCASSFFMSFIAMGYDVLFVLFAYSPIHEGGLGFHPSQIGYALACSGMISATMQVGIMPTLLRRWKASTLYKACMLVWPLAFAFLPMLNLVARLGSRVSKSGAGSTLEPSALVIIWIGIGIVQVLSKISCLAFSMQMLLTKSNAPCPEGLGSTNGLVQAVMCLARIFSPAFVSATFAFTVEHNLLGGQFVWVVMLIICLAGIYIARGVTEGKPR